MSRAWIAPSLLALTLAGCVPDIRGATHPISEQSLGLSATPAPAIDGDWWKSLGDAQLDRIVGDALAGSPTLDIALARLRGAQASLGGARAGLNPTVSSSNDILAARPSKRFLGGGGDAVQTIGIVGVNLNWNLDLFGKQRAAIQQAGASADAARLDVAAARLALAGSIAQTYVAMTSAEAQIGIARDTIGTRENSLKLVQSRVRNQLSSQVEVEAATTLLAQARQRLESATRERTLAANALAALAGRGADYAAAIQPSTLSLTTLPTLPPVLPADLLGRRADIAAARARVEAAAAGQTVAKKAYYPNVNLLGLAGFQAFGLANLFSLDAGVAGGGGAISLPIFEGGKLRAGLEGATAELDLATASYNSAVIGAVRETADAVTQIQSLDRERQQSAEVVHGFSETQRLNGIRIRSGLESRLDIVDTDIRLLDARLADITLAAAEADQRVALIVALGGGFDSRQDKTQ